MSRAFRSANIGTRDSRDKGAGRIAVAPVAARNEIQITPLVSVYHRNDVEPRLDITRLVVVHKLIQSTLFTRITKASRFSATPALIVVNFFVASLSR